LMLRRSIIYFMISSQNRRTLPVAFKAPSCVVAALDPAPMSPIRGGQKPQPKAEVSSPLPPVQGYITYVTYVTYATYPRTGGKGEASPGR
jgi:hypothetical protein